MIDNKQVGRKIAAMRQAASLTQQQLSAMMNVSHQAVSKWESGQALPDIQTMMELTRFFGITVDQLISDAEIQSQPDEYLSEPDADTKPEPHADANPEHSEKEKITMNIQQLLQMAPYMSKETVEEIVCEIEEPLSAGQLARIAPFVRPEVVEKLMDKHSPELTWETLRRIAPYLRREYVDALARNVASGKETIKPTGENFNKTINDISKAFDDVGREMGHAVKKGLRFGKRVIKEVSSAFADIGGDNAQPTAEKPAVSVRSDRAKELRRRAFERAAEDGKWEWLADHIRELDGDRELREKIASKAREADKQDWICEHMGGFADEATIDAAIETANWAWLSENTWQLEKCMQEKVLRAAVEQNNWNWIADCSDQLQMDECGVEIATAALKARENTLAVQIADQHLLPEQVSMLADEAYTAGNMEALDLLLGIAGEDALNRMMILLAEQKSWETVKNHARNAAPETVERLMEFAVEQGNFDAVDMLDLYL